MKNRIILSIYILAVIVVHAVCSVASAQSYYSVDEPGKKYWQVHTDPNTRNTIVQFFNSRNQLIYTETLHRKYVKLTKRNVRYFDDLLNKLTDNSLLASTVKSFDLVADSRTTFRDATRPTGTTALPNYHHTPQSNVYVVKEGRLKIILKNPYRQYFDITILDDQLRTIHYESFDQPGYDRSFDLSKLADGNYKVRINSRGMNLYYKLAVDAQQGYVLENLK